LSNKKRWWLLIALVSYLAGYGVARDAHLMVHGVGYASADGVKLIAEHRMEAGDFGIPMLQPVAALLVLTANVLYIPIKPIEVIYWNIVQPSGSPYPYVISPDVPIADPLAAEVETPEAP
jgi:hypothetical protein